MERERDRDRGRERQRERERQRTNYYIRCQELVCLLHTPE